MIALLGGLGAAICFTASWLCVSAASRAIGAASTLAWVTMIGFALIVVPVALSAPISQLSSGHLALLGSVGFANVAALWIMYIAVRRGKIGVVSAIASSEGVIAATISVLAGASLALGTAILLGTVGVGVALAAARADPDEAHQAGMRAALLAIPVAILFGISLYCMGRVGREVSLLWVVVPTRLVGTVTIALPLALRRKLTLTRRALPLVATAGVTEVLGIVSYTLGARHDLAVAAVLTSQYAALAALGALIVFGERLSRRQLGGLGLIAVGVALLAVVQA
jgi:drug/metabolite transporter (DMT)-like permease